MSLRPYFWLPERTSWGERIKCDNCAHFGEKNETKIDGICGKPGHLCGNWAEAEEIQMNLFSTTTKEEE
jgi:hypothetical protein